MEEEKKKILLEKFKLAAEIQDRYNALFWQRTGVFFAINTALFAGYGVISTEILKQFLNRGSFPVEIIPFIFILMIFGGVGAYLSWLWLHIHQRATFLQNYYRFRAHVIEEDIGEEKDIFGKSYKLANTDTASKEEWEKVFGTEWKSIFRELVGKDWGKDWKKGKTDKVPSSLRKRLDRVYLVFMCVWIFLSLLGGVILLTIFPH